MRHLYLTTLAFLASAMAAMTAQANTMASASNVFGSKLVSRIAEDDNVSTFTYNDANQLTNVTTKTSYGSSSAVFTYESGTYKGEPYDVKVEILDPGEEIICYVTIGDNGFASKSVEVERSFGETADYETYTFEYDDDGHLVKVTEHGIFYNETISLIYEAGDIVSVIKKDKKTETLDVSYTSMSVTKPIENVGRLMNFEAFGFDNFESTYFYYAGFLGKATAHLPILSTETGREGKETTRYEWTINKDGYPVHYKEYEGNRLDDTYTISWTDLAAIVSIDNDKAENDITGYYDIRGYRHDMPMKGLNIQRRADGSTSKVVMR